MYKETPQNFYEGKVETFLTCLNLNAYLKEKIFEDNSAKIFEELSLNALYKALFAKVQISDIELLIRDIPKISLLSYPVVEKIVVALIEIIPKIMSIFHMNTNWRQFTDWNHELDMLKSFQQIDKI